MSNRGHSSELAEAVLDRLRCLGPSSDDVREVLAERGHLGVIGSLGTCPLACYLYSRFPWATTVEVNGEQAIVSRTGVSARVDLPPGCLRFIDRFDLGVYPELTLPKDAAPAATTCGRCWPSVATWG